ncbi:hypothetical protein [Halomonas getboli]|uniref:hypothetical protein n=1 Tax=Halomonas getboli TaxID=2935862 RepID=UPI0020001648|nr:hypothetical protein [Halomonas getboli]MCK2184450.1 hypothetical protein [Halomonas getboli]
MRKPLIRQFFMSNPPSRAAALAAVLAALPCGLAQADAERLEADLRERFAEAGEFSVGEVSDSLLGGETRAEDLSLVEADGSRLDVARYVVKGDYEDPEAIVMEGLRLERAGRDAGVLTADRLRLDGPGGPLPWGEGRLGDAAFEADGLSAEGLRLALESAVITSADGKKTLSPQVPTSGWLSAQRLEAERLTATGVGRLEMSGIEGHAEGVEDVGAGDLTLSSLSLEGLSHPPGDPEAATLDSFELNDMSIVADHLVADLARLSVDGDMHDGEGSARLEALDVDLARMIEMAPPDERTELRLASNVLTGGSGQLRLDAEFDGRWEALGQKSLLSGDGTITAADAFRWTFDSELPVRLPEGVEPEAYLAEMRDLSGVTLLGGRIETTLGDLGLFGRMPAVMAASRGVSEAEFLDQARTQAKGFGTMLGPEFGQLLDGLVDMMAGRASELTVALTLPPESDADVLAADPLGLPSKLSMEVESR